MNCKKLKAWHLAAFQEHKLGRLAHAALSKFPSSHILSLSSKANTLLENMFGVRAWWKKNAPSF
jgi:hypothetical protein